MTTKVYLAGNMHTNWREFVIKEFQGPNSASMIPDVHFLMPLNTPDVSRPGAGNKDWYFLRDKNSVRQADVLFGYIEGYDEHSRHSGLSAEIGIAYALGKTILLVNLMPEVHSFEFLEKMADSVFSSLLEGVKALNFIVRS